MPKNKLQNFVFTIIMVFVMVYTMICYNTAIYMGGMKNSIFLLAFKELIIMYPIAFIVEYLFVHHISENIAFKIVTPKDKKVFIILAMSCATVMLMCPIMSLFGSLLFGFTGFENIIVNYLNAIVINFPMALLFQIFYAGPFVRYVFKKIFKNN
jgi:hypothetical protein